MTERPAMLDTDTTAATSRRRRRLFEFAAYALVVVLGVGAAFVFLRPHTYAGAVMQSPAKAPNLDGMVFHTGEPADLWRFDGDVVLVFFGYTHCPDVCPTTLAAVARAKEQLSEADGARVHTVFVSVDPERDTPAALGDYVTHFDESFLGAGGDEQATHQAEVVYGINVEQHEGTTESGYVVDHTAHLVAIDTDGFIRVIYPTDVAPNLLAADLEELLG
jgi:protein SCO1